MIKLPFNKPSIARQFIFQIVLFSSFITLIITAFQLHRDYDSDINIIHTELKEIESIHLESLNSALWTSNTRLLQTSIEGILKIRDMQYIEIRDEKKIWVKAGEISGNNNIQRRYLMSYQHRGKDINIGSLMVNINLEGVYQRLYDKVWVILISNAVKTFLVAVFIYFLFYHLVGRHLSAISEFSKKHDPLSNNSLLILDRSNNHEDDEFDAVVTSINNMHMRLREQISEIGRRKKYLLQTLNSIGDAVITTDEKGRVTGLNPVAEQLTGWKNDDALNEPLKEIFPIVNVTTREPIVNPVERVLETGETVYLSNHTTLIAKNGHEYQIADSAAPIRDGDKILGMVLVFNDVTEQYRIREALKESEKKLRLIHSQVPGVMFQFKIDAQGKRSLPYVSQAVENHIGVNAEQVMQDAEKWFELTHPDDYEELEKSIIESMNQLSVWEWEGRFIRNDGELVWLSGKSTPEKMEDGSVLWNGIFINVTERVRADETMRRAQKMDALGKLTGGIAHDYNNMLGVVLGYAELLSDRLESQPVLQKYVDKISHAGERGAKLTKKLLSFSRKKSSDAEVLNINTVLLEEQHMLEKTLTARIKLVFKLSDDLWSVFLDESELEDAILNMSINAMHAINTSGELVIETCNEKISTLEGKGLELNAGEYVRLSVSDNGRGMHDSVKEKIFDPFYSTKGEKGTGLGLSQVYGFVTRSGGAIKVESVFEHGTEFTMYFPRVIDDGTNKNSFAGDKAKASKGKASILVVDDEYTLLELTCEILIQQGYRVLSAEGAEQALEILEMESVDVLLSDVIMPDMDGYELASIVLKKYPEVKIQLVSGFSEGHNIEGIDKKLSKEVLQKPCNSQDLLTRIQSLLQAS